MMVINSLKAVFFIAGGAVVAGGAAYVTGALDIFFPEKPTAVASLPAPQSASPTPAAGAPESAAPKVEEPSAPAAEEAAKPQDAAPEAPEVIVPTFDLVRLEPDGSMVIAGRAAPVANIEIVTGASTIGIGESNEAGEFAIVLDDPLKPGDYTIVLRSTTRDAIVATSAQTAIVSVPDHKDGQVLALVEEPGAASRFITVPEAAAPKQDRPVAESPQAEAEAEQVASAPEQPAEEAKPQTPAAETATAPAEEHKPVEQAAVQGDEAPAAEQELAGTPAPAAPPAAEDEQELAGAPAQPAPATAEPQEEQQMAAAQQPTPVARPRIAVEAVEIEGRRVFVAGRAEVGTRVRAYANEILLGDSETSQGGRFLVEAERDLPVGDYIVRADLLGPNAEVLARAAVPFEREPGEAVAAVAAPEPEPVMQQPAAPAEAAAGQTEPAKPMETAAAGDRQEPAKEKPAAEVAAPQATDKPAEQQVASAQAASGPATQTDAAPEATAPKLQNVAGAVIIRRGDTLWRISRRVYGRGVRYTTLYLANQDQIEDPDRIWPGQVFQVPDKTDKGEDADMSTVADRMPDAETKTN